MKINRMLVTGDTHGEYSRFAYYIDKALESGDVLFVTGDFGYIFSDDIHERRFLDDLSARPYTVIFVDGNHENFPAIYSYPEEMWCGGKIHRVRKNIIHLMRGEVYRLPNGKTLFAFGGAYSFDKPFRKEGISWWPQEMPNEDEYENGRKNLQRVNWTVDYILTHTAPENTMNLFHPEHEKEKPLNLYLQEVANSTDYKHWWFGHLHKDMDLSQKMPLSYFTKEDLELIQKQTALWYDIRNMETNEIIYVPKWDDD